MRVSADPRIHHLDDLIHRLVVPLLHPRRAPLAISARALHGEPVGFHEATAGHFEPFAVGGRWGGAWDTVWFHLHGIVPHDWQDPVALVHLGGSEPVGFSAEGLVWSPEGVPLQGLHHRQRKVRVTPGADRGVDLFVEAAANPQPSRVSRGEPPPRPDYLGDPLYALGQAELADTDRQMEALYHDLIVLLRVAAAVAQRREELVSTVESALERLDLSGPAGASASETVAAARALLGRALARSTPCSHRVTAVGHAHIDCAWLWPVRETVRKCARTFANQLRLMEHYPEHRFACSQAAQYQWIRDAYPALFEQIAARVAEGRWEPVGGMWVEPDTNLTSGESLVRQILHANRFCRDHFALETHELWLPDTFGYSAALPQIAARAGMSALVTQKMSWNDTNVFPRSTFWWEGHDGSRILAHFPPSNTYNGEFTAAELVASRDNHRDRLSSDTSLYPFGYGDGGGGPTAAMLEAARRVRSLDGLPGVGIGTVGGFLDGVKRSEANLETWTGELYLERHRGTYTTHADLKAGNRRGEEALRAAEMWSVAAGIDRSDQLDRAWKLLLLNQFHDILAGSSIGWVHDEAVRDLTEVREIAGGITAQAQRTLCRDDVEAAVVFNPSSYERTELVDVGGSTRLVTVPACGWVTVEASPPPVAIPPGGPVVAADGRMENDHLRLTWDHRGLVTSLWDKDAGREVLTPGSVGNLFQLHEDHPRAFDAWDLDRDYLDQSTDLVDAWEVELVEHGPWRAAVRVVRRFGSSEIDQTVSLSAGSRRVDFHTEVDWRESHKLLKVAFPVDVHSTRATYEIQHGHLERPTVANTSWEEARFEVCAHRWADLSEPGYGVALLNDCKYGYDVQGQVMRLSLLRAPAYPDPDADRGAHRFAYALVPHIGDFRSGGVIEEAEAFNLALVVAAGCRPATPSGALIEVDRKGVSVEAVKWAEDGNGVVVRLCEVFGARGPARVKLNVPHSSVARTDLLERRTQWVAAEADGSVMLNLAPFELVTLRFARP